MNNVNIWYVRSCRENVFPEQTYEAAGRRYCVFNVATESTFTDFRLTWWLWSGFAPRLKILSSFDAFSQWRNCTARLFISWISVAIDLGSPEISCLWISGCLYISRPVYPISQFRWKSWRSNRAPRYNFFFFLRHFLFGESDDVVIEKFKEKIIQGSLWFQTNFPIFSILWEVFPFLSLLFDNFICIQ